MKAVKVRKYCKLDCIGCRICEEKLPDAGYRLVYAALVESNEKETKGCECESLSLF